VRRVRLVGWTLVIALTALLVLTTCARPAWHPPPPKPTGTSDGTPGTTGSPEAIATSTGPFDAGPVRAPKAGAYLGAWVKPAQLTEPQRVAAVSMFERQLGRRLDIVNTYRRFDQDLLTESDLTFTERGSTMMISWAGGDTRAVTMGRYDDAIRAGALAVRDYGRPILLRYRWEMDRPGLAASMWSPADYIASWKHVRDVFRDAGATNVSWVWCPTDEGFVGGYAPPFYPGDDQVDWVCVDVYASSRLTPLGDLLRPFLRWSATHPRKPIMIGEFGVARVWGTEQRAAWLRDAALVFKANPQIRAVLYFDSNPENGDGSSRQEFRMSDDPSVLAAFADLAREPYFNPDGR
jgi:Glycosyl hydrolase family 26